MQAKAPSTVVFLRPFSGSKNGAGQAHFNSDLLPHVVTFSLPPCSASPCQVRTFWQLLSYYVNTKFVDKTPLFLNLDETSIPYTMLQLPGCVALPRHASLRMPVWKQDVRGALTYVSTICDAPHIQGKLPHYLFGTETKLTQKLLRGQRRLPQTALHIVRQKSAWTSCKNITKIVRDLGKVLKPYPFQPILLLDVASSHLAKETMVCARRNGVQLLYIPAGCTDKIQPLDIAGFHPLKTHLKRKYQELRAGSCEGLIDPLAWLFELMQCPSYFAGKSWKRTFESVGAAKPPDTAHLHTELRKFMDMPLHMPPGSKPSKEALQSIWPERRRMAYAYTALL